VATLVQVRAGLKRIVPHASAVEQAFSCKRFWAAMRPSFHETHACTHVQCPSL
jgi:hypothetical protein